MFFFVFFSFCFYLLLLRCFLREHFWENSDRVMFVLQNLWWSWSFVFFVAGIKVLWRAIYCWVSFSGRWYSTINSPETLTQHSIKKIWSHLKQKHTKCSFVVITSLKTHKNIYRSESCSETDVDPLLFKKNYHMCKLSLLGSHFIPAFLGDILC